MATFSVDITDVLFAGARTGYKDITITGMPAGGVTTSITPGAYFTYTNNPESKGTNVYRVLTKSTNISSGRSERTATFKIANTSDSTDYVEVSLTQFSTDGKNSSIQYSISNYSYIYVLGMFGLGKANGYFPYSLPNLPVMAEFYVDGTLEDITKSDSWISYTLETTYTDTGFRRLLVSCINNNDGPRKGTISLDGTERCFIFQNGYPSSTSGCTQSLSFLKSGGDKIIELKIPLQVNVNNVIAVQDLPHFNPLIEKVYNTRLNFSVSLLKNNTGSDLRGLVYFEEESNFAYLGHTIITQSAEDLTVDPTSLTYPASGGRLVLDVTYSGTLTTSEFPSWLTYQTVNIDTTHRSYTITASKNSSTSSRSFNLEISNGTDTVTVPITQSGGISVSPKSKNVGNTSGTVQVTVTGSSNITYTISDSWITYQSKTNNVYTFAYTQNSTSSQRTATVTFSASGMTDVVFTLTQAAGAISVSPKSQNVDNTSGTVQVTVTGANNINYSISDSWLTYQSKSDDVYTFSYDTNNNLYSRTATVTFSASGFKPVTYTLNQYGITASFSVIPSSLTFHKEGGSDNLTFFNIPDGGLSWDITYGSGTDWISSLSFNNNVATVTVTENTGSRRNAVIRFYNKNDNDDYLDLNVVQNGEGFDSIWFDRVFEPSSFQVGENYHYRLQDYNTNKIIYEGITVPVSEGEKPLGINIPRLVDSYIHSDELDDLREDMKLRKLNGSLSVDFYDMNGSTPSLVKTFNYWNDWSGPGYNTVYDITKSINDPINHKGCNYMVIPFCIYDDELSSYTVVETKKDDTQVSYPLGTPSDAFMYAAGEFFNAKSVSFKKGNDTLLTYDMDNCGKGFLLYKNRFGGWDSFLIEGNIYKYDEYTRLSGVYPKYPNGYGYSREKMTDRNTIKTRYEINTGWLTDEQAERLVFHLMSSTTVALRSFSDKTVGSFPYNMVSVSITNTEVEYKKFKNGKKMINYTITLEQNDTKQVQR